VFDLHIPWRSHAVLLPCHEYAFLKETSQGHGRIVAGSRHETECWRLASFRSIAQTTPSSSKFVIRSIQISDKGGQCETKLRLENGMGTAWYVWIRLKAVKNKRFRISHKSPCFNLIPFLLLLIFATSHIIYLYDRRDYRNVYSDIWVAVRAKCWPTQCTLHATYFPRPTHLVNTKRILKLTVT
jgi:hypothetical protein